MFLKLEEVHDFLKENSLYDDHTHVIWATKRTGGTSNAYFILAFTLDNLVILDIQLWEKLQELVEFILQRKFCQRN